MSVSDLQQSDIARVRAALPGYDVDGQVGRGGCGVVLAGTHRGLHRRVAIKQIPPQFADDMQVRRRFVAEARVMAALDHPHVVPVYDFIEHEDLCLLVLEFLPGGTVENRFITAGFEATAAVAVALACAAGLDAAHRHGILHRDVKPSNLMFAANGTLKLTDFGIAKIVGGDETLVTRAGDIIGTPSYIAPEQVRGQELSASTDVYALATMLYQLLSGVLPFPPGENALAMLFAHAYGEPVPLGKVAPGVPQPIAAAVMRGLASDPGERFDTAESFGIALAEPAAYCWGSNWLTPIGIPLIGADTIVAAATGGARPLHTPRPRTPADSIPAMDPRGAAGTPPPFGSRRAIPTPGQFTPAPGFDPRMPETQRGCGADGSRGARPEPKTTALNQTPSAAETLMNPATPPSGRQAGPVSGGPRPGEATPPTRSAPGGTRQYGEMTPPSGPQGLIGGQSGSRPSAEWTPPPGTSGRPAPGEPRDPSLEQRGTRQYGEMTPPAGQQGSVSGQGGSRRSSEWTPPAGPSGRPMPGGPRRSAEPTPPAGPHGQSGARHPGAATPGAGQYGSPSGRPAPAAGSAFGGMAGSGRSGPSRPVPETELNPAVPRPWGTDPEHEVPTIRRSGKSGGAPRGPGPMMRIRPQEPIAPGGVRLVDVARADLVPVQRVVTLKPARVPLLSAAVLAALVGGAAVLGIGGAPERNLPAAGTVRIAGVDPAVAGTVELDLSKPVPIAVSGTDADAAKLSWNVLGTSFGGAVTPLQAGPEATAELSAPVNQYVLAGDVTGELTLSRNGSDVATYRFGAHTTQRAITTVTAAGLLLLTLFAAAYTESNARTLRRGSARFAATVGLTICSGLLAVAVVGAGWILLGNEPTRTAVIGCAAVGAIAGFVASIGLRRMGKRYRYVRVLRLRERA